MTDPKGRKMVYSATGFPGASTLAIDASTGVISGEYDAGGFLNESEVFTVTVTARSTGSAKSVSKTFVLSIRNDG